jgi:predicted membrane-bound mannosyltransferase/DNA-binding beta-propeller fold protein YncE
MNEEKSSWLDRPISSLIPRLNVETLLIILILVLAVFSRLYILGARTMSHDEVNHEVPSYELYQGQGYAYDPVTHGPLQFHLIALSFFLFGDTDFTARLPHALLSIATIAFVLFAFRRYIGRTGSLIAGFMFLISPVILFYGRYARQEAIDALFGVMMLWSMLEYFEKGQRKYLYWFTFSVIMHFVDQETAYIYSAVGLIFLAVLLLDRITRRRWPHHEYFRPFVVALIAAVLLGGVGVGWELFGKSIAGAAGLNPATVATPATPGVAAASTSTLNLLPLVMIGLGLLAVMAAIYFVRQGLTWRELRKERSFDLLILLGTLVLPLLAAIPDNLIGWNPLDYSSTGVLHTSLFVALFALIAIVVGMWWNPRLWLTNAALFFGIFTVFYTTFFTNGMGFFTGLVGALGYWMSQQSVNRGSQPLYYYALIQIPMYEYLAGLGTLLAFYLGFRKRLVNPLQIEAEEEDPPADDALDGEIVEEAAPEEAGSEQGEEPYPLPAAEEEAAEVPPLRAPVFGLLGTWSVINLIAFSYAGEKMPWLTVYIELSMILMAGWAFGYLIDTTDWELLRQKRGWLIVLLLPVFFTSLAATLSSLLGTNPPFQGNEVAQLQATSTFFTGGLVLIFSTYGLYRLLKGWPGFQAGRLFGLTFIALLAVLTIHSAIISNFINFNNAKEYLVYAHGAPGPKEVLQQVQEISERTTGGLDIAVAYDNQTLYPFWWYLRHYPNKVYYVDQPTRDLRNDPIILVGQENYSKIEPIVGNLYDEFTYTRLWWPNQDYFNLTWERIWYAVSNPAMRSAIMQIWLNDDFSAYAKATGEGGLTLADWQPSDQMRMYIRKDIVAEMWNYGVGPSAGQTAAVDPYEKGTIKLSADLVVGSSGSGSGQFNGPRGLAVAPDGSVYVADTGNNRIVHLSADGEVLQEWGTFADVAKGPASGGTFNQPWDVAVGPDGSVYVADTWNNRIQKFTADGKFVTMWGYFGQAEKPDAFWGPRGVVVDAKGRVYVTDTGNKRVVVFDSNGNYVTQFGSTGAQPGQFDEPVGIALDQAGNVYIDDTWNQRVQVLAPDATGMTFTPLTSWDISGWFGQSLDNKPYIAVDNQDHVFVTDPEATRVLEFDNKGQFIRAWGQPGTGADGFGLAAGVAADSQGRVWVTDAGNSRVMRFVLPK